MGQGAQSKALRIATKTQYGIDPTKIYNEKGEVVGDIGNFDTSPELFKNQAGTGKLGPAKPDQKELKADDPVTWNYPGKEK